MKEIMQLIELADGSIGNALIDTLEVILGKGKNIWYSYFIHIWIGK